MSGLKTAVIGVDGGETKAHCALFDTDRNKIDMLSWGTTNYECLKGGFGELKEQSGKLI